jgi:ABC-type transport system substrate-binding protein
LVEWKEGDQIRLERNPSYWDTDAAGGKLPYLDGALLKFIIEPLHAGGGPGDR